MLHFRTTLAIALLFAPFARADEATDRSAVERTIAALNAGLSKEDTTPISELFSEGTDNGLDVLVSLSSAQPFSEVTTPRFTVQKIQFVTPDVALVDAAATQYGSLILSRPLQFLFVMTRKGEAWQIASVRASTPQPRAPRAAALAPRAGVR